MGKDAPNLSPSVITRLTWNADYERWQKRDLSARRYVYVWADGVYLQARVEDQAECMLVLIGATPEGRKNSSVSRPAFASAQSWRELLVEVKRRGLKIAPNIAVGDGALGFWKALDEVFPGSRHQRCWVPQDSQRPEQGAALGAGQHEDGFARDLWRAEDIEKQSDDLLAIVVVIVMGIVLASNADVGCL
ncbi:hypothetical protein X732_30740 [Mesorhizobium sp. L2C066B000]|nr:hypothetical protein X732_30740 [Mesorhizobium sp. L2C066B000]